MVMSPISLSLLLSIWVVWLSLSSPLASRSPSEPMPSLLVVPLRSVAALTPSFDRFRTDSCTWLESMADRLHCDQSAHSTPVTVLPREPHHQRNFDALMINSGMYSYDWATSTTAVAGPNPPPSYLLDNEDDDDQVINRVEWLGRSGPADGDISRSDKDEILLELWDDDTIESGSGSGSSVSTSDSASSRYSHFLPLLTTIRNAISVMVISLSSVMLSMHLPITQLMIIKDIWEIRHRHRLVGIGRHNGSARTKRARKSSLRLITTSSFPI